MQATPLTSSPAQPHSLPDSLSTEWAIYRLLNRYCSLLDQCRFIEVAALFAPHGSINLNGEPVVGPQAIEELLRRRSTSRTFHLCGSMLVDVEGPTEAVASSHVAVYKGARLEAQSLLPMAAPVALATYSDRFRSINGQWLFVSREVTVFMA